MSIELRKSVLQLHRWTGLTIGLVLLMMAITGAVNLFRPSLEPVVNRELLTVPTCKERVTLDQLATNARSFHSAGTLDYIRITAGEEGAPRMPATRIRFADPQDDVFLDPCTGRVLGERPRYGGALGSIEQLHILRVSEDKVVRSITGVCAIVFAIVLIGGGIFMWWPHPGRMRAALTPNTRLNGRAWHLNLHQTAGAYAGVILLLLVLTGLPLAFDWYRDGIYRLTNSPLPPKPEKSQVVKGAERISMEAFWLRVQALVPEPADALLKLAGARPDAPLEGFVIERKAPHPNARTMLSLDAYSGKVLRFVPYSTSSLGHKLYFWTLSFHTGEVGGVPVQIALLAGVLAVPVMAYTGFASFLRRRRSTAEQPKTLDVRIRRIVDEAVDVKCYEMVDAAGAALPAFTAGAHVMVHLGQGVARPYSLCNDPAQTDRYLIAVKRAAESRGGSRAMHERVKEGDILRISTPRNHFQLARDVRHHLLVASGIGITPLLAMVHHLASNGASFELHYFSRSIEHAAFHRELSEPKLRGKVSFHHALEPGRLYETLQRILARRVDGAHLYLCGSTRFMTLAKEVAAARWPGDSIHTEYFGVHPMAFADERKAFEITLARSGGTYCVPASKSIIDVLREHALCNIETSCEQGVCGTCLTGVLDGVADHRDAYLSDEERSAGRQMLLCVSRAKSERLVLDL
jgi:ferredoxin-NADP reductase